MTLLWRVRATNGCSVCRAFAATIPRKFGVRYNAYTQSVEVMDNMSQITNFATDLKGTYTIVKKCLLKLFEIVEVSYS